LSGVILIATLRGITYMLCLRIFKRPNWGAIFAPPLGHVYKNWQTYDLHPTTAIAPAQLAAQTSMPSTGLCALAHVGLQLSLALACLRAWTPAPVWCDTGCCLFLLRPARAFLCWAGCRAAWWTASEAPLASAARARCSHEQRPPPTLALRVPRCICHRRHTVPACRSTPRCWLARAPRTAKPTLDPEAHARSCSRKVKARRKRRKQKNKLLTQNFMDLNET
jgi:hypothetical protein